MRILLIILIPVILICAALAALVQFKVIHLPGKAHKTTATTAKAAAAATGPSIAVAQPPPPKDATNPTPVHPSSNSHSAAKPAQTVPAAQASDPELDRKVARLVSVYEQMPVEQASAIFAKLPDPLVEKLLRKMDERQAGKLLASFTTARAVRLTQSLSR